MTTQTLNKVYSDIDLTFTRTPGKNDISISYDSKAVIRALRYLLLTNNYERHFNFEFGARLNQLLFEPISPIIASVLAEEMRLVIKKYEPRVNIQSLNVAALPDNNAYSVTIIFFIGNMTDPTQINLVIERTR